jgi:hypothetical protein
MNIVKNRKGYKKRVLYPFPETIILTHFTSSQLVGNEAIKKVSNAPNMKHANKNLLSLYTSRSLEVMSFGY